ncbi:MAG: 5'-methylthioadenosine/S-adenosylhomocysteine nucleosidase [Verrucomicrobia bacterium]|nr:5'-methylthioadenosine/S-adenosylhomocysteine nucleosidase [Verrucomicrobiota bacterium]MCH8528310.1 5'-methylthioadenosine/S-adenosylhomocysteine nucleosidase [Kiritimatiellia bacterium]
MNVLITHAMPIEKPVCTLPPGCRVLETGIGKVLSTVKTAQAIQADRPDLILSVGFCGGLNGSGQGSLILARETRQWDFFLAIPGIAIGHGYQNHCPLPLPDNDRLLQFLSDKSVVRGTLISGDRFVDREVHIDPDAVAVDMETAALALLAREFRIPFLSLREVSDVADGDAEMTHGQFMNYIQSRGPGYSPVLEKFCMSCI